MRSMRLLARPWPIKPQTMPARLYSKNLTPRQAKREPTLYSRTPVIVVTQGIGEAGVRQGEGAYGRHGKRLPRGCRV